MITNASLVPSRPRPRISLGGWLWKRLFIALLVCLTWDIPLLLIDQPQYLSVQIGIMLIAVPVAIGLGRSLLAGRFESYGVTMLVFVAYAFAVSALSSSAFIPQPLSSWLPGMVFVIPLLLIYAGKALDISVREALDGLIIAAAVGSLFVLADRISPNPHLDIFKHIADYSGVSRRIVVMHNETAIAIVIVFSRLTQNMAVSARLLYLALFCLLGFNLIFAAESRLAIAAAILAIGAYIAFVERGKRRILLMAIGALFAILILPNLLSTYIDQALSAGISEDRSVSTRQIVISNFRNYFEQTHGFGFGLMSVSPSKPNILSNSMYYGAEAYGIPDASFAMVDIRIYAALYQFGYIGLAFVLYLTARSLLTLYLVSRSRIYPLALEAGALASVVGAYMLSPLPINWFTVENTFTLGGIIWMVASRAREESRAAVRASRGHSTLIAAGAVQ